MSNVETFEYESEEVIVGGLKTLGLDPATVKYVIISHAIPARSSARQAQVRHRRHGRPEHHAWRAER
jgi:hypothetical protein